MEGFYSLSSSLVFTTLICLLLVGFYFLRSRRQLRKARALLDVRISEPSYDQRLAHLSLVHEKLNTGIGMDILFIGLLALISAITLGGLYLNA